MKEETKRSGIVRIEEEIIREGPYYLVEFENWFGAPSTTIIALRKDGHTNDILHYYTGKTNAGGRPCLEYCALYHPDLGDRIKAIMFLWFDL